ncbi:hypothetical protein GUITHDRAFT_164603 [Guillardia theta CCMP2712]|uniref:Uncharacterized protein n=2 Tax=Guillardia theta TaxID=55529 RepID=L1IXA3_GUITC|nr:hypothetical protein GUITHDRAFT_164603 [Guillardia theta CCMP2712]EKX40732.1 hypothetical protein GUITHDRAFT_164603 [Guillardia theta CCMP2712]|eukprot:XP_005827712.1 hypothetical protein GUITHDRAFT_164603 [Guillardia theta CCMP2712]
MAAAADLRPVVGVIGFGLISALLIISGGRTELSSPEISLLGRKPFSYPKIHVVKRGTFLAAADSDETDDDKENEAEGKALEDLSDKLNDDERSLWPFPEYARPVRAAHFDAFGRITTNGNCEVNYWTGGSEYAEGNADGLSKLSNTYNFPQNSDCLSGPPGASKRVVDTRANTWGYECYSNGKCSIFPTGKVGDSEQGGDFQHSVDGIAKD